MCIYIYVYIYIITRTYIYIIIYICMCIYIYTYIHPPTPACVRRPDHLCTNVLQLRFRRSKTTVAVRITNRWGFFASKCQGDFHHYELGISSFFRWISGFSIEIIEISMDFNRCIDANDVMEGVGVFTHAAKTGGIPVSTCIHFITGMHYPIIWVF